MNNSNPTTTWKTGNYNKNGGRSGNNFNKSKILFWSNFRKKILKAALLIQDFTLKIRVLIVMIRLYNLKNIQTFNIFLWWRKRKMKSFLSYSWISTLFSPFILQKQWRQVKLKLKFQVKYARHRCLDLTWVKWNCTWA